MVTIIVTCFALAALTFAIAALRYRGKRIVVCPETQQPVCTQVDAMQAAAGRFVITTCSRWPEHAGCDQACAPSIAAWPQETLVTGIVTRWYATHACILCGKHVDGLGGAIVPALRVGDAMRPWSDVPAEELPALLSSAVAVCASCELAESFRRDHPELVTDRRREGPVVERMQNPSGGVY
jgi:hypothetical protein